MGQESNFEREFRQSIKSLSAMCPSCGNAVVILELHFANHHGDGPHETYLAFPKFSQVSRGSVKVPEYIRNDYQEACAVLPISSKASAALSRRIL